MDTVSNTEGLWRIQKQTNKKPKKTNKTTNDRKKKIILCTEFTCKKLDTSWYQRLRPGPRVGSAPPGALSSRWGLRVTTVTVQKYLHACSTLGGRETCCLCHFCCCCLVCFFLKVQRNKKKKSLPTFLQETKFPRKVRYGSLCIYRNRFWTSKRTIFFPFVLILYMRKKNPWN